MGRCDDRPPAGTLQSCHIHTWRKTCENHAPHTHGSTQHNAQLFSFRQNDVKSMTHPHSTTIKLIVTFIAAIQEAQLNRYYRQCLRNQSRAHALSLHRPSESRRSAIRTGYRLFIALRAASCAISDHTRIHQIRRILGIQEYYPHHHRLLASHERVV